MYQYLTELMDYATEKKLIDEEDKTYCINRILNLIGATAYEKTEYQKHDNIEEILDGLLNFAYENKKIPDNTIGYRDLLSADIMDVLTPKPSVVNNNFYSLYEESPKLATQYFYDLSRNDNYIMTERVKKDIRWKTNTKYGEIDITINLSKPEKDPKAIAAAKTQKQTGYPKCLLCAENEGYEGSLTHPPRANHRIIPIDLNGHKWYMQYSPYVYYNEHCIVLNSEHTPMKITEQTFKNLLSFVERFPHYFIGSNADLPIVGGSILTHDHFQGGNYEFAMARCPYRFEVKINGYDDITVGVVDWALSTIRLKGNSVDRIVELAGKILAKWREYSDESNEILAYTDAPHNTITPIARQKDGNFELDLILRNNRTTGEHPLGIFHPHAEYHHIKKENIGLIEAMGLAVLPARLKTELGELTPEKKEEVGQIFACILENCGVFKDTPKGNEGIKKFMETI